MHGKDNEKLTSAFPFKYQAGIKSKFIEKISSEFAFHLIILHQSDLLPKPMSQGHIHEFFPLTPTG